MRWGRRIGVLVVVAGLAAVAVPQALSAPFTVTKTADTADGVCDADCSLREAITAANFLMGPDTITFGIPGPTAPRIQPTTTPLPSITDPVVIDGSAQTDAGGLPLVTLDGSSFSAGGPINGLDFASGSLGSSVAKLAFIHWSTGNSVGVSVASGSSVTVTGSLFGTDATGATGLGNYGGISVIGSATIGGATSAERNVISGNVTGVFIGGTALVKGNWIGVGLDGTSGLPNSFQGVFAQTFATAASAIGGTVPGEGNVISRNTGPGVRLISGGTITVRGNTIDANGGLGIDLDPVGATLGVTPNDPGDIDTGPNGLQNFPVVTSAVQGGGTLTVAGSLDSVAGASYTLDFYVSSACDPSGNGEGARYVGSTIVTPGAFSGVSLPTSAGSPNVLTATASGPDGTSEFSACRSITAGGGSGGTLSGSVATSGGSVDLTAVGPTDWAVWGYASDGTSTSLAPDVRKDGGAAISALTDINPTGAPRRGLGQFTIQTPFTFSWSNGGGPPSSSGAYAGLQHDGQSGGVGTLNGGFSFTAPADTTPRTLRVWVSAHSGTGRLRASLSDGSAPIFEDSSVTGPLNGANVPGVYTLNYAAAGPGATLNVQWIETVSSDSVFFADNVAIYAATLSAADTDPTQTGPTFTVNSSADPGDGTCTVVDCTLREALNAAGTGDTIAFSIPGNGVHTISLAVQALPSFGGSLLDGWSQGGTLYVGPPLIEIDGANAGASADGLLITGDGAEIRGLAIGGFSGDGVELAANYVPTDPPFKLRGTYIGTDATGDTAHPNGRGFYTDDTHNLVIGGPNAFDRNVIAGNTGNGIELDPSSNVRIEGNSIGVGANGTTELGNGGAGILFGGCCSPVDSTVVGNVVANNGGAGIADAFDDGFVKISTNSIHDNGGLGIDLQPGGLAGVTANDQSDCAAVGDNDTGPNGLQNFPDISSAAVSGPQATIDYSIDTKAGTYTVEFFASTTADASGYGEGARYLGTDTITVSDCGPKSGSVTLTPSAPVLPGEAVTATATDASGNTSEFSAAQAAAAASGPPPLATVTLDTTQTSVLSTGRVPLANIPGSAFVARPAGSTESTPIKDIPIKDIPIKDIPIKDIPIKDIPIKDIGFGDTAILPLLGQFPLSEVPLLRTGGWPAALQGTAFESAPLQNVSLGDALGLPAVQALIITFADLDLTRTPLGGLPAIATVLGTVPLGSLPGIDWCLALAGPPVSCSGLNPLPTASSVLSVSIQGAPIKDIPITEIPIKDIPITEIPIKDIPIKDIPIKDIPIKDIALSAIPIKDIAGYATLVDCGRVNCLSGTLYDAFTADPTPAFPAATTVEDLVLALPEPNAVTLADLLVLLFSGSGTIGWEQLNLATAGLQVAAGGANKIDAQATVQLQPNPGPSGVPVTVTVGVTLPAGFVWDPSLAPTATQTVPASAGLPVALGDPIVATDTLGRATLQWTMFGVVGRTYRLDFRVLPALRLGPQGSTAATTPVGGVKATSAPAMVTVTDPFPSNGTLAAADPVSPDSLYVSYVTSTNDLDFFKIPNPTAGSRITVYLSHLPADYDLALYAPADAPMRVAVGEPLDGDPLTDAGVPLANESAALSSEALNDLRIVPNQPLVGISANRGLEDDTVTAIASGTGDYTFQVTPYNGASSNEPYVLRVEITPPRQPLDANALPAISPAAASAPTLAAGTNTLFLVNRGALEAQYPGSAAGVIQSIANTQQSLRQNGYESAIVTLDAYLAVTGAMATFADDPGDAAKANAVVKEINSVVDGLRGQTNGAGIRYLVLVGGDRVIPFARLEDYTTISNEQDYAQVLGRGELFATLGAGFMLSDDPYGDPTPSKYLNRRLYVPEFAVGRLVETPAQIQGTLSRYAQFTGQLNPTATVAGYDFLTDGAKAVATELGASSTSPLLGDTWRRTDLLNALASTTDNITSINAHADHTRFLPPAPTTATTRPPVLSTTDVAGVVSLTNRLLFSMGCHAGLSVADAMIASSLDWPQAFAADGAGAYAGNTTFGYGDTLGIAYSEELNRLFAKQLAAGLNVGDAWRFAKNEYFSTRGVLGVYDEKALAAFTLYGLPMWSVRGPVGPSPASLAPAGPTTLEVQTALAPAAIPATTTGSDPAVGLAVEQFDASPANTEVTPQPAQGRVWRGDSGFQISHLRPVQPKLVIPLTGTTGRNTLVTGLTSGDVPDVDPVYARPIVDSSAAEPELPFNDVAFPAKLPSVRSFLTPSGKGQSLVLVTGQFFGNPATVDEAGRGTQRLFSRIAGQVYRSTSTDVTPPAYQRIDAQLVNGFAAFSVDVTDNTTSGVKRVLVLYRSGGDAVWKTLDLAPGVGGAWSGAGSNGGAAQFEYFVQAVDGGGNVAVSTNKGFYFDGLELPATPPPAPGVTDVVLDPPPAPSSGFFPGTVSVGVNAPTGVVVRVSIDGGTPIPVTGSFPVTGDGVHVLNAVGSNGDTDTKVVAIDATAPTVVFSTPTQGASYTAGSVQKADYACVDPGSGVDPGGCAGTVAVGQPISTSPAGTKSFSVSVRDRAGNTATRSVSYTVSELCAGPAPPGAIVRGSGNDTVNGTPGDDVIVDTGGNNRIDGKGGNDTICSGSGNDTIVAGNGNDTVIDAGGNNTITSGGGDDRITSRSGNDTIVAGDGNDTVNDTGGNNTVDAGSGTDRITTGTGNDKITAGDGDDIVTDAGGNNTVDVGAGSDTVTTGGGNDVIEGGSQNDTINAGNGNNNVKGSAGDDRITTGSGNDTIDGGPGTDICTPGSGNNNVKNCEG